MDYLRISYEIPYGHGPKVLYLKDIFKQDVSLKVHKIEKAEMWTFK